MTDAVVDWNAVELVMLDMDGTVLDLAYDNYFWAELLPQRYAERHGLSLDEAQAQLAPTFLAERGQLNWYCLDFWSARTGFDVAALKAEVRSRIAPLPGSIELIHAVRASGRRLWLVTNAHAGSWQLKMEHTGLADQFDAIFSAHEFDAPKEQAAFWRNLMARHPFDPASALFVDDSLPVLTAARNYGINQVIAVRHPDSGRAPHQVSDFPSISGLGALRPVPSLPTV